MHLPPFVLVLAIPLGSTWPGVIGTVLAVPTAAALVVTLDELRQAVAARSAPILSPALSVRVVDQRSMPTPPTRSGPWWAFWRS